MYIPLDRLIKCLYAKYICKDKETKIYNIRSIFISTYINKYKESLINIKELKEELYYDKDTGNFYWLIPKKGRDVTRPAGTRNNNGYRTITYQGHVYSQHRLAWFYVTGEWPLEFIDHIDGNPHNNKWDNLRQASHAENMRNRKRKFDSHTGIKGVVRDYRSDTWHVHMMINGKVVSRGPFFSYQMACKEYDRLAKDHFGEFAKLEPPRVQRAAFKQEDVSKAIEDHIDRVISSKVSSK